MDQSKRHLVDEESVSYTYQFSPEELGEKATEFAEAMAEKDRLGLEFDGVKKDYKSQIATVETPMSYAARCYREKSEQRSARCDKVADYSTGDMVWVDKATGEIRRQRKMLPGELQYPLLPDSPDSMKRQ